MTSGLLCRYAMLLTTLRRLPVAVEVLLVDACVLVLLHPVRAVFDLDHVPLGRQLHQSVDPQQLASRR